MNAITKIIIAIVAMGIIGVGFWYYAENTKKDSVLYCTMEAKLCPDGSAVGRSGPRCEFKQCPAVNLNHQITLSVGSQATFSDGLVVSLIKINDSRCKSGVVCIWAGELSPVLSVAGTMIGNQPKEVLLGSTNRKEVTKYGYIFKLEDVSETTATINVSEAAVK